MAGLALIGAILSETAGTLALRMASQPSGSKKWFIGVGAGYLAAFALLTVALNGGIAVGVAYGIWAAAGVALTAVLSRILFGEPLTKVMVLGIVMIIGGVIAVELGAQH
ncbi:DMT family transporter [Dactylosporangium sp. NPDC000521]|uniref:DMT family transporter n=1 Tax=Dactylosporangium sp. NPDC000521 TaxID=3363975 RepID=UPI003689D3A3